MSVEEYDFKKIGLFISVFLIILGGIIGGASGFYYYNKYRETEKRFRENSLTNQSDVQSLIDKVTKLIKLPEGEMPTVATVADLSKLANQPFFAKAKIGDKVLLYMQAKKAFLYDPVANVIVEVGPLVIPSPTAGLADTAASEGVAGLATQATPAAQPLNIVIYNGTDTANLTDKFEGQLNAKVQNVKVVRKANAQNRNYAKSVIIDLTGKNQIQIESIAKDMDLSVSALPAEEKSPSDAETLIILGADRQF